MRCTVDHSGSFRGVYLEVFDGKGADWCAPAAWESNPARESASTGLGSGSPRHFWVTRRVPSRRDSRRLAFIDGGPVSRAPDQHNASTFRTWEAAAPYSAQTAVSVVERGRTLRLSVPAPTTVDSVKEPMFRSTE